MRAIFTRLTRFNFYFAGFVALWLLAGSVNVAASIYSEISPITQWQNVLSEAQVLNSSEHDAHHVPIPLAKNHKIDGRWGLAKFQRFEGKLKRSLMQLDDAVPLNELVDAYQRFIDEHGAKVFFSCAGRECGSSNYWANDYFKERQLYAPDKQQYMWVYQLNRQWHIAYLVQRGNGRFYFQYYEMGLKGSVIDHLSLGNKCNLKMGDVEAAQARLFLNASDIIQPRENNNPAVVAVVLTVSLNTDNAWQDSQSYAAACAVRLQKLFDVVLYDSLGLGALTYTYERRVTQSEYTLHRFNP